MGDYSIRASNVITNYKGFVGTPEQLPIWPIPKEGDMYKCESNGCMYVYCGNTFAQVQFRGSEGEIVASYSLEELKLNKDFKELQRIGFV